MASLWEKLSGFDIALEVVDGHDLQALRCVLDKSSNKARIVVMQTVKGHGVEFMENKMQWHYLPMSSQEHMAATGGADGENQVGLS